MKTIDYIKAEMEMSTSWVIGLLADMKDALLVAPTPNGGNHPLWILGHVTYSEIDLINTFIKGVPNPLSEWNDLFGMGSQPVPDANHYPRFDEVMAKFEEVRAGTLACLDSLTDEDLDKPSKAPAEAQAFFGTIGKCLAAVSIHISYHGGQVADARRAAGRGPLMG